MTQVQTKTIAPVLKLARRLFRRVRADLSRYRFGEDLALSVYLLGRGLSGAHGRHVVLQDLAYSRYLFCYHFFLGWWSTLTFVIRARVLGVQLGKRPAIWGKCSIIRFPGSTVQIGDNFRSVGNWMRATASTVNATRIKTLSSTARVAIGSNVGVNGTSITCRSSYIVIEDGTMIAANCVITDSDWHLVDPDNRNNMKDDVDKGVHIGPNVWIGMNSIILKGVKIGKNSVVGAGSVVTKDVDPDCIFAGSPARFVRRLDSGTAH